MKIHCYCRTQIISTTNYYFPITIHQNKKKIPITINETEYNQLHKICAAHKSQSSIYQLTCNAIKHQVKINNSTHLRVYFDLKPDLNNLEAPTREIRLGEVPAMQAFVEINGIFASDDLFFSSFTSFLHHCCCFFFFCSRASTLCVCGC